MREMVTHAVGEMLPPSHAERDQAAASPRTAAEHARWSEQWPCLSQLELVQPPVAPGDKTDFLTIAAWNMERCKHVEASAGVLRERGVDLVLATEMDWGCARSGQRHTTAELAAILGFGHVFGVEFVELGLGDARETDEHAGQPNHHGLHGNAILSRYPFGRVALIPLEAGGSWYLSDKKEGQGRIGGRNVIAAEICAPGGRIWVVSAHFESESTPTLRAAQAEMTVAGLKALTGDAPVVIGGDFNVKSLPRNDLADMAISESPGATEPMFDVLAAAGFDWRSANIPGATTRRHPWQTPLPTIKIDWLFVRGGVGRNPWIGPALGRDGTVLSDHDPIGVDFAPLTDQARTHA